MIKEITPKELAAKLDAKEEIVLLDVREPHEREIASIGGEFVPLGQLQAEFEGLPREKTIVVYCHHGGRSARAVAFLDSQGFSDVINLDGGIHRYSEEVDSSVAQY